MVHLVSPISVLNAEVVSFNASGNKADAGFAVEGHHSAGNYIPVKECCKGNDQ